MKIMICGKGGCGKSSITALLARELVQQTKDVLVIDADESNLYLHRLLGAPQPEIMMDSMGGRKGTRERLKQVADHTHEDEFFKSSMTMDELPSDCITEVGGVKLLLVGKIRSFGEGCACMIGSISKAVLSRLQEKEDEIVLIDAEAGIEQFGRRVNSGCDLVLCVVDPSYESIQMAERTREIAEEAGIQTYYILNKADDTVRDAMIDGLDGKRVIAALPHSQEVFLQGLKGEPLTAGFAELEEAVSFIKNYRKPLSLNLAL